MSGPRPPVGLKSIALAAGVSAATVSRILNNKTEGFSVRPAVRRKVLAAARDLGYRPDLMARSLRRKAMGIVAILGLRNPLDVREHTVLGMLDGFEPHGVNLSAYYVPPGAAPHRMPPWRVDGAVAVATLSADDVAPVEDAGIPYVSINGHCGPHGSAVLTDDADGTRQAMAHLIGLGHRRIAYAHVAGPWATHPSVAARHDTYLAALRAAGLAPVAGHDVPVDDPPDTFVKRAIVERGATAVLAYHLFHAIGILRAVRVAGLRVPEDVSLVCFNDEYPVGHLFPSLTAVRLPEREMGRAAAELLVERMRSTRARPRSVTLGEKLVVRESTAPPGRA